MAMARVLACIAALLVLSAAWPVAAAQPLQPGLVYTPVDWPQPLAGDFYRPAGNARVPVVLLIHGGGWRSGKREHMAAFAEALVAQGYAAFSISYRFAPAFHFPAQLDDVRQALHWLRQQAPVLAIDPDRIAAWGYSAGAHLATLAALGDGDTPLRAVVAGGLPADLLAMADSNLVRGLMGGSLAEIGAARYRAASPLAQVHEGAPPVFLFHASWDWVVAPQQARDMQQALQRSGVAVELQWLPARGHVAGFFFNDSAVQAALVFLDRYLKAP